MPSALDTAIQTASTAETALNTDTAALTNLQAAAAQAVAPVAAQQAVVATDVTAFNSALDALSTAALEAKIPPPAPASA